jgi:hypothetical protein
MPKTKRRILTITARVTVRVDAENNEAVREVLREFRKTLPDPGDSVFGAIPTGSKGYNSYRIRSIHVPHI